MRNWTKDELDHVHPLGDVDGDHWEWLENGVDPATGAQLWAAVVLDHDYGEPEVESIVCVDALGRLDVSMGEGERPPIDVSLAVVLASKGLDSYAEMARTCAIRSEALWSEAFEQDRHGTDRIEGEAQAWDDVADMLNRGRVNP